MSTADDRFGVSVVTLRDGRVIDLSGLTPAAAVAALRIAGVTLGMIASTVHSLPAGTLPASSPDLLAMTGELHRLADACGATVPAPVRAAILALAWAVREDGRPALVGLLNDALQDAADRAADAAGGELPEALDRVIALVDFAVNGP